MVNKTYSQSPTYVHLSSCTYKKIQDLIMASSFYILFSCSICVTLGIPTLDLYFPSRQHPNMLRLECINDGQADFNAEFEFYNGMNVSLRNQSTDVNENYLTYNITADSEALVRCIAGEERSEATTFAGKNTV